MEHMFEALREAVGEIELPLSGAEIAELLSLRDRLDAKLCGAIEAFDRECEWQFDGATSLHAWLRDIGGRGRRDAGRLKATAQRLGAMPDVAQAWQRGSLSSGHVDAIVANVDRRVAGLFGQHQAELVLVLEQLSAIECETAMRTWRARADAVLDPEVEGEAERSMHLSSTLDGRFVGDLRLDAESGQLVRTAVELAETADVEGEPARTPAQRRADALVDVAKFFLDHHDRAVKRRNRPHVNVIVSEEQHARFVDGGPLSPAAASMTLCDCELHRLVMSADSEVLDYGRATRVMSPGQWASLAARDQGCRFPGCDRPPQFCDAHHVEWFSHGGHTRLDNLVLTCRRHHRLLHKGAWHATLEPDGTLAVKDPNGNKRTSRPPSAITSCV